MEPETLTPTPVKVAELSEGAWPSRFAALARVSDADPVPGELHEALVGLLAAPEAEQRARAVSAVVRAGPAVVPLLTALFADGTPDDPDTRRAAVVALGRFGPAARSAVPLLRDLAGDPWHGPCARAALAAIDPPRGGFRVLGPALAGAALTAVAFAALPSGAAGPVAVALGVIGLSIVVGLWWTRPGAVGLVWVAAVGAAVAVAVGLWATGGVTNVFAELARALARP